MTADHRRAERFSLQLPAKIQPILSEDEDILDLVTSDICSGGAYFHTGNPLPVGTEVKVEIFLPLEKLKSIEGKQVHVRVTGAVIRTTVDGMAISFSNNCVFSPWPEKKE